MTIGQRIKNRREELGYGQTELADKVHISKQTLYKYENDLITNIPSDKIELIAQVLNCRASYLMGWQSIEDRLAELEKQIPELEEKIQKYEEDHPLSDYSPTALEIARAFDQAAEYQQLAVCQLLGVDYKKETESSRDVG